jgi:hypothetical protein
MRNYRITYYQERIDVEVGWWKSGLLWGITSLYGLKKSWNPANNQTEDLSNAKSALNYKHGDGYVWQLSKICPTTCHGGAWGERGYSSYSFSTSALDGGEWSASCPGSALALGKGPPVPTIQEAGWAPELVWTQRLEEKSFHICRESNPDRPVIQPIARHYTEWATQLLTTIRLWKFSTNENKEQK